MADAFVRPRERCGIAVGHGVASGLDRIEEAVSELEATSHDLARVEDIVSEVERKVNALRRQVGRARRYAAYRIADRDIDVLADTARSATGSPPVPHIAPGHIAAILFTSGSTGEPRAQSKTWEELYGVTLRAMDRFAFRETGHQIVATVPAQHSYGFESSVLYTLLGPGTVHSGHPLYPADVCEALHALEAPRVLITTPLHLDVCLRAGLDWPELAGIVSATAPLDPDLAASAESQLGTILFEIYGCSEAGALARRRTNKESAVIPYAGVRRGRKGGGLRLQGA